MIFFCLILSGIIILQQIGIIIKLKELEYKKFELRKNENLKPCTIKFKEGFSIIRTDTGEPVDEITLVEYSNIGVRNENKRES